MKIITALLFLLGTIFLVQCNIKSKEESTNQQQNCEVKYAMKSSPKIPINFGLANLDEQTISISFKEFRSNLFRDIESHNQDGILASISDTLEFNPGTATGKSGVIETWKLDGTQEKLQPLELLIKKLFSNGGCFGKPYEDSTFTGPYYNCISEVDKKACTESGCGVAKKNGAEVYQEPTKLSGKQEKLQGNEIVISVLDTVCNCKFTDCKWQKITRKNGQIGFVENGKVQTNSEGEIWIIQENSGWKIRKISGPGINIDDT